MICIIAIDPGNVTGISVGFIHQKPMWYSINLTPKKANKSRDAEPEHYRYGKLWDELDRITKDAAMQTISEGKGLPDFHIICENATGFIKGKAAVQVSNSYRGVVKAFAYIRKCRFFGIEPNDLQRFACGKGRAEKTEVMQIAKDRYGYEGTDDNESDSLIMFHFLKEQIEKPLAF